MPGYKSYDETERTGYVLRQRPQRQYWNVGNGVEEYANGGTTACAEMPPLAAPGRVAER